MMGTSDVPRVEAPITVRAYLLCAFAAFGGILFGYDSGYINGVIGTNFFINQLSATNLDKAPALTASNTSLIVSILSAGTFFGALISGDLSDWYGRRTTIIAGCFVFTIGVILQIATGYDQLALLVVGRLIAGVGVGFVSAIVILYMSEVAPRKVRGAIVSVYQFAITIGILLASVVDYATETRNDSGSYRIPIGIQFAWAIILATGLFLLPESPRYFVKRGNLTSAAKSLARVRGQPIESEYIQAELAEIVANYEYEMQLIPQSTWFSSWANCFKGSLWTPNSNLRRTILGTSLQMMQQWTGINFIFYYSTTFLQSLGTISNVFLISLIFTLVNVCSTPISFYTIEKIGRRPLLVWGALGMLVCEFIVAIVGTTDLGSDSAVRALVAFICIYIFFFASTWGPGAWVVIGEIFPLPIRSRGVALSTASNWLWNCVSPHLFPNSSIGHPLIPSQIISVITPYMVGVDKGNLGPKVFFVWGTLCIGCFFYAYFLIFETKGLTLEQVDRMMEECTPRTSSGWRPTTTYASEMGIAEKGGMQREGVPDLEKPGAVV